MGFLRKLRSLRGPGGVATCVEPIKGPELQRDDAERAMADMASASTAATSARSATPPADAGQPSPPGAEAPALAEAEAGAVAASLREVAGRSPGLCRRPPPEIRRHRPPPVGLVLAAGEEAADEHGGERVDPPPPLRDVAPPVWQEDVASVASGSSYSGWVPELRPSLYESERPRSPCANVTGELQRWGLSATRRHDVGLGALVVRGRGFNSLPLPGVLDEGWDDETLMDDILEEADVVGVASGLVFGDDRRFMATTGCGGFRIDIPLGAEAMRATSPCARTIRTSHYISQLAALDDEHRRLEEALEGICSHEDDASDNGPDEKEVLLSCLEPSPRSDSAREEVWVLLESLQAGGENVSAPVSKPSVEVW